MGGSGRDIRSISGIDRVSINVYPLLWISNGGGAEISGDGDKGKMDE